MRVLPAVVYAGASRSIRCVAGSADGVRHAVSVPGCVAARRGLRQITPPVARWVEITPPTGESRHYPPPGCPTGIREGVIALRRPKDVLAYIARMMPSAVVTRADAVAGPAQTGARRRTTCPCGGARANHGRRDRMGNVVTSNEWTDEERAQLAAVSAEYDAAEGAVQAAAQRLDDAVEAAHAAGERVLLRLLRERNEAVANLAAMGVTNDAVDPPGRFYFTLPLASLADRDDYGREALVREHAQRPSLVVEVPLAEMNAEEGRAIAYAMLRVCRSLDAQARAGAEEGADS